MKTFVVAFATLLTGCLVATAQATVPVKGVQQQVVRYGDLNLASQADAAVLRGRIKSAARRVCSGSHAALPIPMEIRSVQQRCVEDAIARALADVDASASLKRAGEVVVLNAFE